MTCSSLTTTPARYSDAYKSGPREELRPGRIGIGPVRNVTA